MSFERYDIYWANLDPTIGSETNKTRPVVIVSDNMMNKFLNTLITCPLTSKLHPTWRSRIQIMCNGQESEIAVDQIRTISKKRLYKKIERLSAQDAAVLRRLITEMYGE